MWLIDPYWPTIRKYFTDTTPRCKYCHTTKARCMIMMEDSGTTCCATCGHMDYGQERNGTY